MVPSSSLEPSAEAKRKGTRSVSTLTPSQLARKRANDREAQRAIRARTKEHIERLERGLEELKNKQIRDQTVQELLQRNKALEEELARLKETMGVSMTSSPYSTPVYDENLSTGSDAIPSPRTSPFPSSDYGSLPDYSGQYVPIPNNCETWTSTVFCPIPFNFSSSSSSANTDEYHAGYIPTSVPASMLHSNITSTSNISAVGHKDVRLEYGDLDPGTRPSSWGDGYENEDPNCSYSADAAFRLSHPAMQAALHTYMAQQQQQHQSQWNMHQGVYCPQARTLSAHADESAAPYTTKFAESIPT